MSCCLETSDLGKEKTESSQKTCGHKENLIRSHVNYKFNNFSGPSEDVPTSSKLRETNMKIVDSESITGQSEAT